MRPLVWLLNDMANSFSGVVGFVRSYGKFLPEQNITLNAVCPHVARTSISTSDFYDSLQEKGLLTPMQGIVDAFMQFVDRGDQSGECLEIGPVDGIKLREAPAVLNKESEMLNDLLYERHHPLNMLGVLFSEHSSCRVFRRRHDWHELAGTCSKSKCICKPSSTVPPGQSCQA
jgi:hypothetical protein